MTDPLKAFMQANALSAPAFAPDSRYHGLDTAQWQRADGEPVVWCEVPPWARWSYWRDPERTAAAWRGDAFTVGDLGQVVERTFINFDWDPT